MDKVEVVALPVCSCAEVFGENPDCVRHGVATEWALENILPSDWQEMVLGYRRELTASEPLLAQARAQAVEDAAITHEELVRRMREHEMFKPSIDAVLEWTKRGVIRALAQSEGEGKA